LYAVATKSADLPLWESQHKLIGFVVTGLTMLCLF